MGRRSRIWLTIALALSLNAGQLSVIAPPANAATTLNPWSSTGPLATAREEHTATALADGTVLVAGGQQQIPNPPASGTRTVLSSAEIYDPATGTFAATGALLAPRRQHTATLLASGRVLIVGGVTPGNGNGDIAITTAELYDPVSRTFTATGTPTLSNSARTATLVPGGKVLVTGADTGADLYDPTAGTFTATGSMVSAHGSSYTATHLASGKVLIAGGYNFSAGGTLSAAEVYDPVTGAFTATTGTLQQARSSHTATLLQNGKVLVAGGEVCPDNCTQLLSAELFDPATGTFTATASMAVTRSGHTATLLGNGWVVVAGGQYSSAWDARATAEIYNPATGIFTPAGTMANGRFAHTATCAGSRVLMVGGDRLFTSLASAELFSVGCGGAAGITGIAQCAPDDGATTQVPGALVTLLSGTSVVATTVADPVTGRYAFPTAAPGTYSLVIRKGRVVCGGPVTVDSSGSAFPGVQTFPIDLGNHSWPRAYTIPLADNGLGGLVAPLTREHITRRDQSEWFVFHGQAGSSVIITLTGLPANYDLTFYKDIKLAFKALATPKDLTRLVAEFAPDAYSPDAYSPDAYSPDAYSPDSFSPDAYSPDAFSPDSFSPDSFSPDSFSPDAYSPDAYSPDAYSPDAFSPDRFSPDAYSPDAFSPDAFSPDPSSSDRFSPDAYSGAQTRSLYGVSAHNGTAGEGIYRHTWDNDGDFYIRVRGRNGAYSLAAPFQLNITLLPGKCGTVQPVPSNITRASAAAGASRTILVTDIAGTPTNATSAADVAAERSALSTALATFATAAGGAVVDVAADARVSLARTQAAANPDCPFAQNILAGEIKAIIDAYRAARPTITSVVLVGNDGVIPFFRYPDQAGLASEKGYVPPVKDTSASQASLRLGYVLSQDKYGSSVEISLNDHTFPIPELPVGRLVETAADITGMLNAYPVGGVVATPTSALVTGYDFLADAAAAIGSELTAGLGARGRVDSLIEAGGLPPTDPTAWNAAQLRTQLLGSRHDLVFLGGHFSATSALAADFTTRLLSSEVVTSAVDLTNTIIFSEGCHSGYNIVDDAAIPNLTLSPDYPQAFARKRATVIAGTGYQYGDTDFIEYGERLYLEFSRQLRTGSGPVSVGAALVAAKRAYLAGTQLRGIHEKTLLQTTLYGLPQLSVNMPGARLPANVDTSIVTATTAATAGPGSILGLTTADVQVNPALASHTVTLTNTTAPHAVRQATYLSGGNGSIANPAEPVLPLELRNVSAPGVVLRGVGYRGGTYTDTPNVLPLTGAAATELRTPHVPFASSVLYPVRPWRVDYSGALAGGATRLSITPAQYRTDSPLSLTGTQRQFGPMSFRLYYSANLTTYPSHELNNVPALAAAPAISHVSGVPGNGAVSFGISVEGDPSAGIQDVWIVYTGVAGTPLAGTWSSLDLMQSRNSSSGFDVDHPSSLWIATLQLPTGQSAADVRYIVQAANGVGIVSLDTNRGTYYTPAAETVAPESPKQDTDVTITSVTPPVPAAGDPTPYVYRESVSVTAQLKSGGAGLPNQVLAFSVGAERRFALTDSNGTATMSLPLLQVPGPDYRLQVSFEETDQYLGNSADVTPFSIARAATRITFAPACGSIQATLTDTSSLTAPRRLRDQTVFIQVSGLTTDTSAVITDYQGRAPANIANLAAGTYTVAASYGTVTTVAGTFVFPNDRYASVTTPGVTLSAGITTVSAAYTGQTLAPVGSPLPVTATVSTTSGTRDLTGAIVCFVARDERGVAWTQAASPIVLAAGTTLSGAATASLVGLPVGVYTIETTVVGGTAAAGFFSTATANAIAVVFDTSTFVTGGGWIATPAGVGGFVAAEKKANFGFNAKYKDDHVTPTGNLEFDAKTNGVKFKAKTFDWLVIAGGRAELQGTGTIDKSTTTWQFRLVAVDGASDTFDLRIWDPTAATGNSFDSPKYHAGPSTLGGGEVKIH